MSISENIYRTLFIVAFCAFQLSAQASGQHDLAAKAYSEGKYQEAVTLWKELYANGNTDPDLFYNIGNAESMLGNTPEAIYFYEKAYRFKPGNQDINAAIQAERNKIVDSVSTIEMFFLVKWVKTYLSILRPGAWAFLSMLFFLIALLKWLYTIGVIKFNKIVFKGRTLSFVILGVIFLWISLLSYRQ